MKTKQEAPTKKQEPLADDAELERLLEEEVVGGIDTVPLPEMPMAIGTWPTPERPRLALRSLPHARFSF